MDDKNSQGAPHDNLIPIPGVRYLIKVRGQSESRNALYAPTRPGSEFHWLSLAFEDRPGEWLLVRDEDVTIETELFNPHPPTRTQWGIKHIDHDCPRGQKGRVTSYGDNRQLMNEEFPNDRHYVRVARQVTETEWQEVDQ